MGDVAKVLGQGNFKYAQYADYVAKTPAVAIAEGADIIYVGDKSSGDVFAERTVTADEMAGILEMNDADVRVTAEGIELNMADSVPYPLNLAYVALVKGLFYNADHLNALYDLVQNLQQTDLEQAKKAIVTQGMEAKFGEGTIRDIAKDIYFMVGPTLEPGEQHYLQPLEAVIFKMICPKEVTKKQLKIMIG